MVATLMPNKIGGFTEQKFGPIEPPFDELISHANIILRRLRMHYRNGREAHNGDKIVKLSESGKVVAFGVLHSAVPGNDYCNGNIAAIQPPNDYACMCDCLHIDDVAELLQAAGLEKRPAGK